MTNNKQQTAVEWFIEELEEKGKAYEENQIVRTINICIDVSDYMELKVQAQEMDKERLTDAYHDGKNNGMDISHPWSKTKEISAEEWYNETYGEQ